MERGWSKRTEARAMGRDWEPGTDILRTQGGSCLGGDERGGLERRWAGRTPDPAHSGLRPEEKNSPQEELQETGECRGGSCSGESEGLQRGFPLDRGSGGWGPKPPGAGNLGFSECLCPLLTLPGHGPAPRSAACLTDLQVLYHSMKVVVVPCVGLWYQHGMDCLPRHTSVQG